MVKHSHMASDAPNPEPAPARQTYTVGDLTIHLGPAPPVYAPSGPVAICFNMASGEKAAADLVEAEAETTRRGGVLMVVQCPTAETEIEAHLGARGYTYASSWYYGPPVSPEIPSEVGQPANGLTLREAVAADVPRILEIGEVKREQYETFSPIFWKKAPTPRQEFAPYVTGQVESERNIALVAEQGGIMSGYLIAQCGNLAEGYVDDYAVADPAVDWPNTGTALMAEAGRRAAERGVASIVIVSGHADTPKRAALESLGFTLTKNWLALPLTPTA